MSMSAPHQYQVRCSWSGSTGLGYEQYTRTHLATTWPSTVTLALSADPAFRGDSSLLNPEQLVVLAASSCQLLSFLAIAARARVDVIGYEDDAIGYMPEDDHPIRLSRIALRPRITVVGDIDEAALLRLVGLAHNECYIANSLTSEIVVSPKLELSG
jgi:organic hydroperoxide reductase OsmC/OhrA